MPLTNSMRAITERGLVTREAFRLSLEAVPPSERDVWVDRVLGIESFPEDGPELPRGCVPYLPCAVDVLLRMIEEAGVRRADVFVDVGSGLGRAAAVVHLLTWAAAIGLEIQSHLVRTSRTMGARLGLSRFSVIEGDAAELIGLGTIGSVFFLYCPFSGERLAKVMNDLRSIARTRPIRVCCVDLPLPACSWLTPVLPCSGDLAIYRSTLVGA